MWHIAIGVSRAEAVPSSLSNIARGFMSKLERRAQMIERVVPVSVPDFTRADKFRMWDGSSDAEMWTRLTQFRERCIMHTISEVAQYNHGGGDIEGLVAELWGIDVDEVNDIYDHHAGEIDDRALLRREID